MPRLFGWLKTEPRLDRFPIPMTATLRPPGSNTVNGLRIVAMSELLAALRIAELVVRGQDGEVRPLLELDARR